MIVLLNFYLHHSQYVWFPEDMAAVHHRLCTGLADCHSCHCHTSLHMTKINTSPRSKLLLSTVYVQLYKTVVLLYPECHKEFFGEEKYSRGLGAQPPPPPRHRRVNVSSLDNFHYHFFGNSQHTKSVYMYVTTTIYN